jgi:hypothetical protein
MTLHALTLKGVRHFFIKLYVILKAFIQQQF